MQCWVMSNQIQVKLIHIRPKQVCWVMQGLTILAPNDGSLSKLKNKVLQLHRILKEEHICTI